MNQKSFITINVNFFQEDELMNIILNGFFHREKYSKNFSTKNLFSFFKGY